MFSSFRRKLTNYNDPKSLGSRMRARRAQPIISLIEASYRARGACRILDVGGTINYWSIVPRDFLRRNGARITLLNLRATTVDASDADIFESVAGDACRMPEYPDGHFDVVHSNSVVEHVGLWRNMEMMAGEVRRTGKAYYVQTPNFWFPVEPHFLFPFLHWLPFPWRVRLARSVPMGTWPRAASVGEAVIAQQSAILLNAGMMKTLFPDAVLSKERIIGLPKSLVAVRPEPA